jgi:hypothetical protein
MIELLEKTMTSADAHALIEQLNLEDLDVGYWDKYQDCCETFSLMERKFPVFFERAFRSCDVVTSERRFDESGQLIDSTESEASRTFVVPILNISVNPIPLLELINQKYPMKSEMTETDNGFTTKSLDLFPDILFIEVQRVLHNMPELISQSVEPPLSLSLQKRVYTLHSAVIFQSKAGHYVTYVRRDVYDVDSNWITCNDSILSLTSYQSIQDSIRQGTLYVYIDQEKIPEVLTPTVEYQNERNLYNFSISLKTPGWHKIMSAENRLVCMKYCSLSDSERKRFPGLSALLSSSQLQSFNIRRSTLTDDIQILEQRITGRNCLFLL